MLHNLASSLILAMIVVAIEPWFQKTLACLFFFQTSEGTIMSMEAMAFLIFPCPEAIFVHQSLTQASFSHREVSISCQPNEGRIAFQMPAVK
jgi:hypothetical protein